VTAELNEMVQYLHLNLTYGLFFQSWSTLGVTLGYFRDTRTLAPPNPHLQQGVRVSVGGVGDFTGTEGSKTHVGSTEKGRDVARYICDYLQNPIPV